MRRIVLAAILGGWLFSAYAQAAPPAAARPTFDGRLPLTDRPWPADARKFSFIIIGDRTGGGAENWPIFDRAVDEINLLDPDFAIFIGDHIEGYVRDTTQVVAMWREFSQHADRLKVPMFSVVGNHDMSYPEMRDWWVRHRGRTYYSFDYEGAHFIILNTQEAPGGLGEEQVRFVLDDLARHGDARRTFLFMHQPAWAGEEPTDGWARVEAALAGRRYTVFGGHWHRAEYTEKDGNVRIAVGPTGAGITPSAIKPFGSFHHYTQVTVDGDSARIAFIEPGSVLPQDIAPRPFREAATRLIRAEALPPAGLETGEPTLGMVVTIDNQLPDVANVAIAFPGVGATGWRMIEGANPAEVAVASGSTQKVRVRFAAPAARLADVPRVRFTCTYQGTQLLDAAQRMPVFPDSLLRPIPAWQVVGPFAVGQIGREQERDPRRIVPRAFERLGPEAGWSRSATFTEGGARLRWQETQAGDGGTIVFDGLLGTPTPINAMAYALCGIWSPAAQTVYAQLREDDYAQVMLNGRTLDDGKLYRSRRDVAYVALPLEAGWNTVIVKVVNIAGGWSFRLLAADPGGVLRFASHPGR